MPDTKVSPPENERIDLRNPWIAGFLAWLVPGLGHYYQKRYHKALIFFLCIVPTFVAGCALASSPEVGIARNVYWSWRPGDMRLWWLVQSPLGMTAIPSLTQAWQINNGQQPMFGKFMTRPKLDSRDKSGISPTIDELRQKLPHYELGTYFVVIACLMNLLVILDAVNGPFIGRRNEKITENAEDSAQPKN